MPVRVQMKTNGAGNRKSILKNKSVRQAVSMARLLILRRPPG
jgi:hypothetical protein